MLHFIVSYLIAFKLKKVKKKKECKAACVFSVLGYTFNPRWHLPTWGNSSCSCDQMSGKSTPTSSSSIKRFKSFLFSLRKRCIMHHRVTHKVGEGGGGARREWYPGWRGLPVKKRGFVSTGQVVTESLAGWRRCQTWRWAARSRCERAEPFQVWT